MVQPIFVIGRNRSGTKWLSNILANHPNVAAIQRKGAGGILETNIFLNYPRLLGTIQEEENYTAFKILFENSNFFKTSGLNVENVFSKRYKSFYPFFRDFMDQYAEYKGLDHWVQKVTSIKFPDLLQAYPDAKFVVIQRQNLHDNILSNMLLKDGKSISYKKTLKHVFLYYLHKRIENKFYNNRNVTFVKYEDLKFQQTDTVNRLCDFLSIEYSDQLLEKSFVPNTSYNKIRKEDVDSPKLRLYISLISIVFRFLPLILLKLIYKINLVFKAIDNRYGKFTPLSFSIYRQENSHKN